MVVASKEKIELSVYFSSHPSNVVIGYNQWGGQWWVISVDRYYYGRIWTSKFGWQNDVKLNGLLCLDDLDTAIDLIKQYHSDLIIHTRCVEEFRWDSDL